MKFRGTRLEIRMSHLDHNFRALKSMAGSGFFCPMIKANAYGHGVQKVAERLTELGVKHLGVATLDEALELKGVAHQSQVLIFSRFTEDSCKEIVNQEFVPVISRFEDLEFFISEAKAKSKQISVHIKINTGIHRMGFDVKQASKLHSILKSASNIRVEGLLTHLSHGEDAGSKEGHSQRQLDLFSKSTKELFTLNKNMKTHILNTQGLLTRSKAFDDAATLGARPGIGLYGVLNDSRLSLRPVMRVVSQVDHLRSVSKGEGVSYGWTWTASQDSVIAIVPIGYADGYHRALSNKVHMLINGIRVPIVGTVCMDYTLLDVTGLVSQGNVSIGDEVVVLGEQNGEQISADELAGAAGTVNYEILTSFGRKNRLEES